MAAAQFDLILEEHSNLSFDFTYLDKNDNPIDLTGYGATIVFAKGGSSDSITTDPIIKGSNTDGWIGIGGANGVINLNVPYTEFQNMSVKKGVWQLYIYPTSGDITDRPKRLIEGEWKFSKSYLK